MYDAFTALDKKEQAIVHVKWDKQLEGLKDAHPQLAPSPAVQSRALQRKADTFVSIVSVLASSWF